MHITHVALWARDLETLTRFYCGVFDGELGEPYHNPRKLFSSRFVRFGSGASLELMHRSDIVEPANMPFFGLAHLAFSLGSEAAVDAMTIHLQQTGLRHLDGPRRTGDGYYESVFLDPEGNQIELTV